MAIMLDAMFGIIMGMKVRGDAARAAVQELGMLGHKRRDAADAAADVDADAFCVERSGDAAVGHGLAGRRHRKMGVDIAVQDVQLFHVLPRVKVAHLGGELDGIVGGVEFCDRADAARAGAKGVPERWGRRCRRG